MSRLKVTKEETPATLYLADGKTLSGDLYLAPLSQTRSGPQTVEDLMTETGCALPFRGPQGEFLLIGKRSIAAAAVSAASGKPSGFWTPLSVHVHLSGGHRIEGNLLVEEGAWTRLSTFLNSAPSWLAVESGDALIWVAKEHVIVLKPATAS